MVNDESRIQIISEYGLRKGEEDASLVDLAQSVAFLLDMPIALVSLLGENEQFFKARVGLTLESTPKEHSFCGQVVSLDQAMIIHDAISDERFMDNPLVVGEPHIRFYAGVPLRLKNVTVGALCVIDRKPREFSSAQLDVLLKLSAHITSYLSLLREHSHLQQEHSLMDNSPAVLMKWRNLQGLQLKYVSANIETLFELPTAALRAQTIRFEDYLQPNDLTDFNFLLNNHQAGVTHGEAHFQICSPTGKSFWIKLISKAFFSSDGKLDAIHALLIDNTASKYVEQKLTQTNQQMRLLLDASGLGTWDWHLPSDKSKVNRRWCDMIGVDFELYDPSSQYWLSFVHPADNLRLKEELARHLAGETQVLNTVYRMRHAEGHWVWIESYGKIVERQPDGSPLRLAGTHRDITYRKEAELLETKQRQLLSFINKAQAAYLSNNHLSQACQEVLHELTEIADSQFAFIGQMKHAQGKSRLFIHAITELSWNEQSHRLVNMYREGNLYFESFDNLFGQVITSQQVVISNEPHNHPASRGTPAGHPKIFRFLGLPIKLKGELVGMVGLANKLTHYSDGDAEFLQPLTDALASLFFAVDMEEARLKAEAQLKNLVMLDTLTGIPNRRAFLEHCGLLGSQAKGYVLAIVDIDHFKLVNDQHGHLAGDEVLKSVAQALRHGIRTDDYVARLGGEEFAIVIDNAESDTAGSILEALVRSIAQLQVELNGMRIGVTISIGATHIAPLHHQSITEQIADADTALYRAKDHGRNCLMWF